MTQGARIAFFVTAIVISVGAVLLWPSDVPTSATVKVILFAILITAAFSSSLTEHFFTKPTDVVANGTAAILLLLPAAEELHRLGGLYYALLAYYAFMVVAASTSIILFSLAGDEQSRVAVVARLLKTFSTRVGNFKLIYATGYFAVVLFYVRSDSWIFLVLMLYFGLVLAIEPGRTFRSILFAIRGDAPTAVGDIFGVQARNVFLAKLRRDRAALRRFDQVEFRYRLDGATRKCLIIDSYLLNEEQWIKIIPFQTSTDRASEPLDANVVYHRLGQEENEAISRLLGIVVDGSSIGQIKFEYASRNVVFQGKLVEVRIGDQNVLYQIVQGTTVEETLERKNKSGAIDGDAAQLGVWSAVSQRFERFGWVPEINSLVLEPSAPEIRPIRPGELELGHIPGTAYPVIMNMDDAISHHLAIFGVTGSGKSVFARWLLQRYVEHGVLVICVDNTLEYQKKFPATLWRALVGDADNDEIRKKVGGICAELEKWPKDRDRKLLQKLETDICSVFAKSVDALAAEKGKLGILNLPDLTSTIEGLEYIRCFFSAVFEHAKAGKFGDRKVCIVMEEAHTLVPEWNFSGSDEKRSQALVNTISQIALQGRKYNVGLVAIGQRTANVAKTVLTQCNSVIAFQQFDPTGLEFFSHYMGREFAEGLSVLQTRRAVAVGKAFAAGVPLIFEVPTIDETAPANVEVVAADEGASGNGT